MTFKCFSVKCDHSKCFAVVRMLKMFHNPEVAVYVVPLHLMGSCRCAEFKEAQADGWKKQYQYKADRKKEYMAPSEAELKGYSACFFHLVIGE